MEIVPNSYHNTDSAINRAASSRPGKRQVHLCLKDTYQSRDQIAHRMARATEILLAGLARLEQQEGVRQ